MRRSVLLLRSLAAPRPLCSAPSAPSARTACFSAARVGGEAPVFRAALGARRLHLAGAVREEVVVGGATFGLETGRLARLADGAVVCDSGGTAVLATLVCEPDAALDKDFLPLQARPHTPQRFTTTHSLTNTPRQVDYRERSGAGGRIPATFTRREGAPKDREILAARVVDRALRPLFPRGFYNETQLIVNVLAADGLLEPDALAINAASAALCASSVPWAGPVGAVRLARVGGVNVLNPRPEVAETAELSILYAGTEDRCLMIEASATGDGVSASVFAQALREAHAAAAALVPAQRALAQRAGAPKRAPCAPASPPHMLACVRSAVGAQLRALFCEEHGLGKAERAHRMNALKKDAIASLDPPPNPAQAEALFDDICSEVLRALALDKGVRVDGRRLDQLRTISALAGVLPHVHGSSLFERGDTQALATVTVGGLDDAQRLDSLVGPASKRLMLHYGFPPFSVNETGKINQPSRREIGHGALAEKALTGSLPSPETFPFAVRVNSETLASNGSSSMAAVCAGSMAMMDAGVPLGRHVAGISIGLIMEEDAQGQVTRHVLLTDIQGLEDHLGDMDWKLAGTREGITAAQLDVKPQGVPLEILIEALQPASVARGAILDVLAAAIAAPSADARPSAPRFQTLPVPRDQLGRLIGPGGSTVKDIERRTGCKLTVQDKEAASRVAVFAPDAASLAAAVAAIELAIGGGAKVGATYKGRVVSLREFGAFVELQPSGEQGLLHISEVSHARTERIEDAVTMEQELEVLVLAKDPAGKLKLSIKALTQPPSSAGSRDRVAFDRRRMGGH